MSCNLKKVEKILTGKEKKKIKWENNDTVITKSPLEKKYTNYEVKS